MERPEKNVIDAIDELVNEQLAGGPIDDYNANYYPKCPNCGCDWHGVACARCGCENCHGEVEVRQTPLPYMRRRRDINFSFNIPDPDEEDEDDPVFRRWVPCNQGLGDRRAYTLSDIEAIRQESWRPSDSIPEGFVPIGFLSPDGLDISLDVDRDSLRRGGDVVQAAQERTETIIQVNDPQGLMDILRRETW